MKEEIEGIVEADLEKLYAAMDKLEKQSTHSGFVAEADMFDYDNDYFDIELKLIPEDESESEFTEQYKICRKPFEIEEA